VTANSTSLGSPRSATARPTYRGITPTDIPACLDVFYASSEDLHARLGQPIWPRNPARLARLFDHLVRSDSAGSWLAESDGRAIAFGMAHLREDHWFLAFLFVLPEWQSHGVGRALIERCLPAGPDRARARLGVCVEAIQPVSTGLYATFGMTPRVPIYLLTGRIDRAALVAGVDRDAPGLEATALGDPAVPETAALLDQVDREVLGYSRPQEHAYVHAAGARGFAFRDPSSAAVAGYGYYQPSGAIGPVAMLRPEDLTTALGFLTGQIDAAAWQVIVPAGADHALMPLIRAGLRIDGAPAVYCSSWPGPRFDRYLPINFALL
jgi:GNAT superfamily N-acetyltransferase